MDAGIILTFITLGKYLEARAKGRASAAIRKLLDLAPPLANVQRGGADRDAFRRTRSPSARRSWCGPAKKCRSMPRCCGPVERGRVVADWRVDSGEKKALASEILAGTINGQGALTARVAQARPGKTALAQVVRAGAPSPGIENRNPAAGRPRRVVVRAGRAG